MTDAPLSAPLDALPPDYAESLRLVAEASAARPFVVAQLGQSLDGRIALPNGESRWINNASALDHLHRLRAAVDVVVVGIGTALADDPLLNVRRVAGRSPARVVIDPRGRLPSCAKLLHNDGAETAVVTTADAVTPPGVTRIVLERSGGSFAPREVVDALFARGWRRILLEGGAQTVSSFVDADVVDRLHVLVAPLLLGTGKAGLTLEPVTRIADARRPLARVHVLGDGDVLFDCDLRSSRGAA